MPNEKEVVDIESRIVEKSMKETKKGDLYYEFSLEDNNGKKATWRWFCGGGKDPKGEETAKLLKKGDYVKGMGELTHSEWNGQPTTFRNINALWKNEIVEEEIGVPKAPSEVKFVPRVQVGDSLKMKVVSCGSEETFETVLNEFASKNKVRYTQTHFAIFDTKPVFVAVIFYEA